jgi:hypothetical protein
MAVTKDAVRRLATIGWFRSSSRFTVCVDPPHLLLSRLSI